MRRVHLFVEGSTERLVLPRLLRELGISVGVGPPLVVRGSKFFAQIGRRVAAILSKAMDDHVFACPDLAPKQHVPWRYSDSPGLCEAMQGEVRRHLATRLAPRATRSAMVRFHPHPFRHDFEVLLLAMPGPLGTYLRAESDITRHFNARQPEEQDFDRYPKRIVEFLFRKFLGRRYNDVEDYRAILERASAEDFRRTEALCPCFAAFVRDLRNTIAA